MRQRFLKVLFSAAIILGLAGVSGVSAGEVKSLRDQAISDADLAPPVYALMKDKKFEKSFRQQPPLIPHEVDKYQINLNANECLKCHDWRNAEKEKAPEAGQSHYKDREGNELDVVTKGRWFCNQCHAPQTDAMPLVENTFNPK